MSEAVSALNGGRFAGLIVVEDAGPRGMITLRADLSDPTVGAALSGAGVAIPVSGRASGDPEGVGALWMSPDELMIHCPYDDVRRVADALARGLGAVHHLVADVSDARAVFRLSGDGRAIRESLAKLSPADVRPASLPVGQVRRTRLAQVPAAFWFTAEDEAVLIAFRSVAEYVFGLLSNAAAPKSDVGYF